jgi:UDP-N-acetylglucosamine 4,6-dehydratase/5-epimerase
MRILITGGSGTIGKAFIREFPEHKYYNVSRNEKFLTDLMREHPDVTNFIGNIEDKEFLFRVFKDVKPDVVIHAAAMKHINIAEENPIQACQSNVIGSINVINASVMANVPITVGISTDKACSSESVYGDTKSLMEKCFIEANTNTNKFALCRFANVTHSNGSVLPFWLKCKKENQPIKITDPDMNRLMFSKSDSAKLINKVINKCKSDGGGFVGSYKMKSVNMMEIAETIAYEGFITEVEVVGKRPGEKVNEDLISESEIPFTYIEGDMIYIYNKKNNGTNKLTEGYSSASAEKMTETEIKDLIWDTK